METVAIVLRRSRKKMIAENRRVEIRNLWERVSLKVLIGEGVASEMQFVAGPLHSIIMRMDCGMKGS